MFDFFLLPNQGSNLDFTDPESVVLPITPLGIFYGCKNTVFLNAARKIGKFFFEILVTAKFSCRKMFNINSCCTLSPSCTRA